MGMRTRLGKRTVTFLQYAFAALLSVAIYVFLYRAWRADLRVPMNPVRGDYTMFMSTLFKGMIDNPWYSHNAYLGAPTGLDAHDYPIPDLLFLFWVKGGSLVTRNPFLLANVTLILSFPLVTLSALFALRRLRIRYSIALVASLLYSFSAFHHMRGLQHVFYAVGYFTVPLATLVALDLVTGEPVVFEEGATWWRPKLALRSHRSMLAVGIAVVIGLTGTVYFPFFSSFFLVLAGLVGAVRRRAPVPLFRALAVTAIVGTLFTALVSPSLLYFHEHGRIALLQRDAADAEPYGLKITQLLLPVSGHRVERLRLLKAKYDVRAPLHESTSEYLGVVGGLGFLYLTCTLLFGKPPRRSTEQKEANAKTGIDDARDPPLDPEVMRGLRVLNLAAVLLGTVGGFGAIFAFLLYGEIRSYNRISVYIGYFCLTALAILAERAARRARAGTLAALLLPVALVGVLWLGLLDQAPLIDLRYAAFKEDFQGEDRFISAIEASIPPQSSVFQLPFVPFPDNPPVEKLEDYALFRPYLHSKTIHWSYGAIRGRRGDQWNRDMAARPVPAMIDALAEAGYAGIHVTRDGLADHGAAVEASLSAVLGEPALVGPNGSASFFPLAKRAATLRAELGEGTFAARGEDIREPVFLGWLEGYYPVESSKDETWVWCRAHGRFVIENPSAATRTVTLDTFVRSGDGPALVRIDGDLFHEEIHAEPWGFHLVKTFDVPPGEHFFRVESDGKPWPVTTDARDLYVEMYNPRVTVAGERRN
jgi:hypothetical protein